MALSWLVSLSLAVLIGAVAWRGPMPMIGLTVFVPWMIFRESTRPRATALALAYYLAASTPSVAVAQAFEPNNPAQGWLIWLAASVILALPWAAFWNFDSAKSLWRCPAALILSAIPPFGLIGWASPLTSAGVLFPGTGFLGLLATVLLPTVWTARPYLLIGIVAAANLIFSPTSPPFDIRVVNTQECPDLFQKEEAARAAIHFAQANIVILPEGAVRRWTEATEEFWSSTIQQLRTSNRTALIRVGIPIVNSQEFHNSVITIGDSQSVTFNQRIPIPIGMWKPFGPADGVPLNLTGPSTLQIGPHRLAILICYEQLLVWPILQSALEKPSLIVGISNAAWTRHTNIPAAQQACLSAWSRLFGIPYVAAVNG
jgi:apolipoprotein N-acyltransferase